MKKQEKKSLDTKPKRQRIVIGSIVEIPIDGNYFVYAQILYDGGYAFFDYRSSESISDLSVLEHTSVLFIVAVYDYVIHKNIWRIVGKLPVREKLRAQPMEYIYDRITDRFSLYNPNTGKIIPTTKDKARGLERAAVWGDNHIEDRIRDYYNNVPCIWLKDHYRLFPESVPKIGGSDSEIGG